MNINVYGMGYVGCVSAVCLAHRGHVVTGIDIDALKTSMINKGESPVIEPGLQSAMQSAVKSGRLRALTHDPGQAEVSMVCVGTPSNDNGSLNLEYMTRVVTQIGTYLRDLNTYHVVNIRSTVLPGTVEGVVIPLLEKQSAKRAGRDFGVCMNPEFLREGSSIADFQHPPFTLVGEFDQRSGNVVANLYTNVEASCIRTSIKAAEMIKYACNAFHALKVTFANEIGNLCKRLNIDSHEVMDIFCRDNKLNISPYYLKPGFAFGGSCLPKDLRAVLYKAKELDVELPVLNAILHSNTRQIDLAYQQVKKTGMKQIGILGLSFKPGTDDLRESPMVELIEKLLGKGYEISIHDEEVTLSQIVGSNKSYIEMAIPHISSLMKTTIAEVVDNAQVIVVGKKNEEYKKIAASFEKNQFIVDLVKILPNSGERHSNYDGICW